jgi:hypothetical protein
VPGQPSPGTHGPPLDDQGRASKTRLNGVSAARRNRATRETAVSMFLSPKTVEYHLRHVYQKLNIHSRDELARAFPGEGR